ncbi:hypothetical protein [Sulfurospirillum barnesii]|uniref:Fimbrial assembly protein (PilN) n=1 Tax=Sulfurospirillum barnesii (strain ATCC 700032 / DSM 10660 / SES-3) TaxID=760154 RepID=I3XX51_SULBS|nr:hypothetical protein [Sulfurospirillum barnesii]AFL68525.1 hypothetical protein Sulba_1231 [Sulfurospirillum barnesii SES-3]
MNIHEGKRSTTEIISIDSQTLASYIYSKNEIKLNNLEKSNKDAFFISYLHTRDVISTIIDISRNIPDSDINDAIEIKVYDELALDSSIAYSMNYTETDSSDTKNRSFNVFLIDTNLLNTKFRFVCDKIPYIDYITTAPFLLKSLYHKNFIDADGTHGFVYFQKADAFLALYKNGEYLYSKSLHYSLREMNEKFCELMGERIDEDDFYKLLTHEGLRKSNTLYKEYLAQLFEEIFLYISDVLVFTKRTYAIDYVDKIYIGSEVGSFFGTDEYTKNYLGLEPFEFNFNIAINSKEWYIDQIHILMMLTAQHYIENLDDRLNFSLYKRPPALKERPAGKLLGVMAVSLLIGFAYPAYQFVYHSFLTLKMNQQTNTYNTIVQQTSLIRQELALLKTEKAKIDALVSSETSKFEFRKKLLNEIYSKKISYPMKAVVLTEIFALSNKNGCRLESIEFKKNVFHFNIRNSDEKKITEFIKDLTALKTYYVNTDKIQYDDTLKFYTSKIAIGLSHE